jgi:hypothetical protein
MISELITLESVLRAVTRRWPIWCSLALIATFGVLLRFVPSVSWWGLIYGTLRIDLWWPVIPVLISGIFFGVGHRRHGGTGETQFFPVLASVTLILVLWMVTVMISLTAAHWGLMWCIVGLVAVALNSYLLALALVAYSECWRKLCHEALMARVSGLIDKDEIESFLEKEKRRNQWGSLHGLVLIRNEYLKRKRTELLSRNAGAISDAHLEAAVTAGNALFLYLGMRWAPAILDEPDRRSLKREIARELLTMCLATRQHEQAMRTTKPERRRLRMARWSEELQAGEHPYYRFLVRCFELAVLPNQDVSTVNQTLVTMRAYSRAIDEAQAVALLGASHLRSVMQNTWLALAHNSLPPQAVFDFWMEIRRGENAGPLLPRQSADSVDYDAASGEARRFLATHCANLVAITSPGWGNGFAARQKWYATE